MSDLWDMTAAAVSFVFGLGVMAGMVITVSGWGIYGTMFDRDTQAETASPDCACAALSGAAAPAGGDETADLPRAPWDGQQALTR